MNFDPTLPWCTYRSSHPSGCTYEGKGKTINVLAGKYKGSGVKFNLSLTYPGYEWDTWTTEVLATFATEDEAYAAEAILVPVEKLANPLCLNMMAGGGGAARYKTHARLLKSIRTAEKKTRTIEEKMKKATRVAEQRKKQREKDQRLRAALRKTK